MDTDPGVVTYDKPPRRPFEAMPVGCGDLTAMVRVADTVELHLGKCDSWGFRDWHNRIHTPELLCPARVTVHLDPDPTDPEAMLSFRQNLRPLRGLVEAEIRTRSGALGVTVYGDMDRDVLVVDILDGRTDRGALEVELSHWRNEGACQKHDGFLLSEEFLEDAAMPDREPGTADPFQGLGIGIAIGADAPGALRWWGRENASLILPKDGPERTRILISCRVVPPEGDPEREGKSALYYRGGAWSGDPASPAGRALASLREALSVEAGAHRDAHDAWWEAFWSRSQLRLSGDDDAAYLTRLWHLFHYQMAISGRGEYPTHFNGGPGVFERDLRSWNLARMWQNDREHLWPLDGANHPDLAENVWRMYARMLPCLRRLTRATWGIDGVWLPEMHQPWWDRVQAPREGASDPAAGKGAAWAGGLRKDRAGDYCSHIFSSGPELVQQMLDHARHTGDGEFLRAVAYPWLSGVCTFYAHWARPGENGLFHFAPANANEMWWKVGDTMNDLCAVRVLFPELIALSDLYGTDAALAARCREILLRLPDLPSGRWRVVEEGAKTRIEADPSAGAYGPAREPLGETRSHNQENPECTVIFPWSLAGIGAEDGGRAERTWSLRGYGNTAGWSQCGVQAARLGRADAAETILDHARRHQRFPYGGWNSPGAMPYRLPDGTRLADCPYLDAAGENATALQEMLLQSHPRRWPDHAVRFALGDDAESGDVGYGTMSGGPIRLCPAVPARWSGSFTLHAMGGFLVRCVFTAGKPDRVRIGSERGNRCILVNPWHGGVVLDGGPEGRRVLCGGTIDFPTEAGERYILHPAP